MHLRAFTSGDCIGIINNMLRKKDISTDMQRTDLCRCFGLIDLTFLAISGMFGSGLYVLAGSVAHIAGPSIVISYILAAIAAVLSALSYAEFAARIPVAGSAYQFTYLTVGEFWAFLVGWNVSFEHTIYVAVIAKTCSSYFDGLIGKAIENYMVVHAPMHGGEFLAKYPDFLAVFLIAVFTIVLITGVKVSSKVNIAITLVNVAVILFIIVTGLILANWDNWSHENFFPHGWSGTMQGATILVYSYVGFEVVASATEEAVNAGRDIPLALLISIAVVVFSFVGSSGALTLIVPWQNISTTTPFPSAYAMRGWVWAKYIVSIGALAAMVTCLLSVLFVIPRYVLAMARDGMLWRFLTILNSKTQVPYVSTILIASISAFMAMLFSHHTLVEFIAIGQLMACTFVSVCIIKLRYEPNRLSSYERSDDYPSNALPEDMKLEKLKAGLSSSDFTSTSTSKKDPDADSTIAPAEHTHEGSIGKDLIAGEEAQSSRSSSIKGESVTLVHSNCGLIKKTVLYSPLGFLLQWTNSFRPGILPFYSLLVAFFSSIVIVIMVVFGSSMITDSWFIIILVMLVTLTLLCLGFICLFIQDNSISTFKVPFVPFLPFISIVINVALMTKLQPVTWLRFAIWIVIGLVVYFAYGYHHSVAGIAAENEEDTS